MQSVEPVSLDFRPGSGAIPDAEDAAKLIGPRTRAIILISQLATAAIENRQANLDLLLVETEPLANSAQNLYSALSLADAAAATAFISGGLEPAEVRDRYTQSIGEASADDGLNAFEVDIVFGGKVARVGLGGFHTSI